MLFYTLVLCLALWSVDGEISREDFEGYSIRPYTHTHWGWWGHEDWCKEYSYAYGFRLKVQANQGSGDDTALNGIQLFCRNSCGKFTNSITSSVGRRGDWKASKNCSSGLFLSGAQAKSEPDVKRSDDTAANDYNFIGRADENEAEFELLKGDGGTWGSWSSPIDVCPYNQYICGIRTEVAWLPIDGDYTSLNGALFYCCAFAKTLICEETESSKQEDETFQDMQTKHTDKPQVVKVGMKTD